MITKGAAARVPRVDPAPAPPVRAARGLPASEQLAKGAALIARKVALTKVDLNLIRKHLKAAKLSYTGTADECVERLAAHQIQTGGKDLLECDVCHGFSAAAYEDCPFCGAADDDEAKEVDDEEDDDEAKEVDQARALLDRRWLRLADRDGFLSVEPPPQRWLLTMQRDGREVGVLPVGRTGVMVARGGTGKTLFASSLAVAVAIGSSWLGAFHVADPGHVLLALAEEDENEARRRLWRTCNALGLSHAERKTVQERLHVLPLTGQSNIELTEPTGRGGGVCATAFAEALHKRLCDEGVEWRLVVLDPLARFARGNVEGDNETATAFVQVVETLTMVPGAPAVLLTHHSSKASSNAGANDSRGVTALTDGFRWQVALDELKSTDGKTSGLRLRNLKSNYSRKFEDLLLVRNDAPGLEGTLRLADGAESLGLSSTRERVTECALAERVLEAVRRKPGLKSASAIAARTTGTREKTLEAVRSLRSNGRLLLTDDGFVVTGSETSSELA